VTIVCKEQKSYELDGVRQREINNGGNFIWLKKLVNSAKNPRAVEEGQKRLVRKEVRSAKLKGPENKGWI